MKVLIISLALFLAVIFIMNYNHIASRIDRLMAFLSLVVIMASAVVTYYIAFCPALTINLGKPFKESTIDTPIIIGNHHNASGLASIKVELKQGNAHYIEKNGHYSGKIRWPIGAKEAIQGHYEFGKHFKDRTQPLKACITFSWTNSMYLTIDSCKRIWQDIRYWWCGI